MKIKHLIKRSLVDSSRCPACELKDDWHWDVDRTMGICRNAECYVSAVFLAEFPGYGYDDVWYVEVVGKEDVKNLTTCFHEVLICDD